jgi:hypothetical protein
MILVDHIQPKENASDPSPGPIIKNPKLVADNGLYSGFGHIIESGPNEMKLFTRIGTGHLEQGYIAYYKSPDHWQPVYGPGLL